MEFLGRVFDWVTTVSHWRCPGGIPDRLLEHSQISLAAIVTAATVAIPIGLVVGHVRKGGAVAVNVANVGRALPSLALLIFFQDIFGLGAKPAYAAMVALALPPMLTNTYIGVRDVDADVREAARGMGMRGREILWRVELPLALPLIVAGLRTASVNVIATATLAAVVAGGGLGRFIVDGLRQGDNPQAFSGAFMVAALAIGTDVALGGIQRRLIRRSATVAGVQREEELVHALVP